MRWCCYIFGGCGRGGVLVLVLLLILAVLLHAGGAVHVPRPGRRSSLVVLGHGSGHAVPCKVLYLKILSLETDILYLLSDTLHSSWSDRMLTHILSEQLYTRVLHIQPLLDATNVLNTITTCKQQHNRKMQISKMPKKICTNKET